MRARVLATLVVAVFPSLAHGSFEGVLDYKLSGDRMLGTMRTWTSKAGLRSETALQMPDGRTVKSITLVKSDRPTVGYMIDDFSQSYLVVEDDSRKADTKGTHTKRSEAAPKETYAVKRLGKDRVAGFACENVALTSSDGEKYEMCVAPDLPVDLAWTQAFEDGALNALLKAGFRGMPVRWESRSEQGIFRLELISLRKQSVPASFFEIPPGYTKREVNMPGRKPEASKQLEESMKLQQEALENLPPEQRKQMEEMMKKQGGDQ